MPKPARHALAVLVAGLNIGGAFAAERFPDWYGIFAPAKTSSMVVTLLNRDIVKVVAMPATKEQLAVHGVTAASSSLSEYAAEVKNDLRTWTDVAKGAGIRPQ